MPFFTRTPPGPWVGTWTDPNGSTTTCDDMDVRHRAEYAKHLRNVGPTPYQDFIFSGCHGLRARIRQALLDTGHSVEHLLRYDECCTTLYVYRHKVTRQLRTNCNSCGSRWCPRCGRLYARRMRRRILEAIPRVRHKLRFITLTWASRPDEALGDTVTALREAFTRLKETTLWVNKVRGGVAVIEAIPSKTHANSWHVHYHLAADAGWIHQHELKAAWIAATRNRGWKVDIQLARDGRRLGHYLSSYLSKAVDGAVSTHADLLATYIAAFKRRPRLSFFGEWYGQGIPAKVDEACQGDHKIGLEDDWEFLGTLDTLSDRAARGDVHADAIIVELGLPLPVRSRAPPSTQSDPATTPNHQHRLTWSNAA